MQHGEHETRQTINHHSTRAKYIHVLPTYIRSIRLHKSKHTSNRYTFYTCMHMRREPYRGGLVQRVIPSGERVRRGSGFDRTYISVCGRIRGHLHTGLRCLLCGFVYFITPQTSPSVSLKSELLVELPFDNAANEQSTRIDTSYKLSGGRQW